MEAIIIESGIAGSVTRVELRAASFPDQRILRMIIDGLASDGTLFELTRDGEPCHELHSREPGKRNEEMMSDDNGQALPAFSVSFGPAKSIKSQVRQLSVILSLMRVGLSPWGILTSWTNRLERLGIRHGSLNDRLVCRACATFAVEIR